MNDSGGRSRSSRARAAASAEATARALARQGAKVAIAARRRDRHLRDGVRETIRARFRDIERLGADDIADAVQYS